MQKKKKVELQITELFMSKAGWDRCFHGIIKRKTDEEGRPFVYSEIKINKGYIYSRASDQWILGQMLDELTIMVLDNELHNNAGVTSIIAKTLFFHN